MPLLEKNDRVVRKSSKGTYVNISNFRIRLTNCVKEEIVLAIFVPSFFQWKGFRVSLFFIAATSGVVYTFS